MGEQRSANIIAIGKISKPVGLKGAFRVLLISSGSGTLELVKEVFIDGESFEVESVSLRRDRATLKVKGLDELGTVEKLKGAEVGIDSEALPREKEGDFYHYELIGCLVYTTDGEFLGKLEGIAETGANDVFIVRKGKKEYLIPSIDSVIKEIDNKRKLIKIDRSGLMDD